MSENILEKSKFSQTYALGHNRYNLIVDLDALKYENTGIVLQKIDENGEPSIKSIHIGVLEFLNIQAMFSNAAKFLDDRIEYGNESSE